MNVSRRLPLFLLFSLILLLLMAGPAFAAWPDLTAEVLGHYTISEDQVEGISDGFGDGTWRPYAQITRAQFVKMAMDALGIPGLTPPEPTYADVIGIDQYFAVVEGATAAGLIEGYPDGFFRPYAPISREQGAAIIARYLAMNAQIELGSFYTAAEITAILGPFADDEQVSASLRPEMAYAVEKGVIRGTDTDMLNPRQGLFRIQGAAMLIRAAQIPPPVNYGFIFDLAGSITMGAGTPTPFDTTYTGFSHFESVLNAANGLTVTAVVGAVEQDGTPVDLTGRDTFTIEIDAGGNVTSVDAGALGFEPTDLGAVTALLNHLVQLKAAPIASFTPGVSTWTGTAPLALPGLDGPLAVDYDIEYVSLTDGIAEFAYTFDFTLNHVAQVNLAPIMQLAGMTPPAASIVVPVTLTGDVQVTGSVEITEDGAVVISANAAATSANLQGAFSTVPPGMESLLLLSPVQLGGTAELSMLLSD